MSDIDQKHYQPGAADRVRGRAAALFRPNQLSGALGILIVLVAVFAVVAPNFFTSTNLLNILRQYSVTLILAVGMTAVIIAAGIDLSVAATAALAGCVMGVTYAHLGMPEPVAVSAGVASGVAVGVFNGIAITKWRVPDIIATLGTLTAVRGIALLITDGLPVPDYARVSEEGRRMPPVVTALGQESFLGIPLIAIVAMLVAVVGWFILARTKFGRSVYATGGNREAARVSGIDVDRTRLRVYILSATLAAIGGMLLAGRLGSANALMANLMELDAIAAVVIGGTALFGGEGGVGGTVIGVLIIGVLSNGLDIVGLSDFWQRVVTGMIIIVVVAVDQWRRSRAAKRSSNAR